MPQNASLDNSGTPANLPENNESGECPAGEVESNESHVDEGGSFSMVISTCSISQQNCQAMTPLR